MNTNTGKLNGPSRPDFDLDQVAHHMRSVRVMPRNNVTRIVKADRLKVVTRIARTQFRTLEAHTARAYLYACPVRRLLASIDESRWFPHI